MKKFAKVASVALCAAALTIGFTACGEEEPPYSFVNEEHAVAQADAGMTIDGKFDEACWNNVRWLIAEDKPNSMQSADIDFVSFIGGKGVYFGMKVVEHGNKIWVNPNRTSWVNSTMEMYLGPVGVENGSHKTLEFDFQADGTIGSNRVNSPVGWLSANTVWEIMPVVASQTLGGELNTEECNGYQIEAFFPFEFLEFVGWDVSDPENMIMGIDPVHIFSLNYTGEDVGANETNDRVWSRWASKYLPDIGWLNPDTYFHFGKDGLVAYDYNITFSGTGRGNVTEKYGLPYVLGQRAAEFEITAVNGADITKVTVNGKDYTNALRREGATAVLAVGKPTEDLNIEIEID